MQSIIDLCFLCTKGYNCVPVGEKIVSQVEYLLPEITIIKLGVPLRICSACDGALYSFGKFKQSSVESSRRLEASIKGAQSRSLHTGSPPVVDDNESLSVKPEIIEEIFIKDEPLDTQMHTNPNSLLEINFVEPQNQFHKDRVSQNMQLHTDTNSYNIEEIFIKQEQIEETSQDLLKEKFARNPLNDDTDSQPEYNPEDESDELWEGSSTDSKEETVGNCSKTNKNTDLMIYPCSICNKRFFNKRNLQQHIQFHFEQKNTTTIQINDAFSCPICNKKFENKHVANRHMKIHSGVKDFQCEICEKLFLRKDYLTAHMLMHSGVKDFKCKICDKLFKRKDYLFEHMKIHTGVKDFQCEFCEKSFMWKCALTRHMKIHSGIKDFKCEICGKLFQREDYLTTHMKIHSGVKEFKCEICNKLFTWKGHLIRHMKTHKNIFRVKSEVNYLDGMQINFSHENS